MSIVMVDRIHRRSNCVRVTLLERERTCDREPELLADGLLGLEIQGAVRSWLIADRGYFRMRLISDEQIGDAVELLVGRNRQAHWLRGRDHRRHVVSLPEGRTYH